VHAYKNMMGDVIFLNQLFLLNLPLFFFFYLASRVFSSSFTLLWRNRGKLEETNQLSYINTHITLLHFSCWIALVHWVVFSNVLDVHPYRHNTAIKYPLSKWLPLLQVLGSALDEVSSPSPAQLLPMSTMAPASSYALLLTSFCQMQIILGIQSDARKYY